MERFFRDICIGSAKAIPDLSPWCQCTSCMGTWTKWSRVCGKGLIVSVEVLAGDYLMSTWQQQLKEGKLWEYRFLKLWEYCFLKMWEYCFLEKKLWEYCFLKINYNLLWGTIASWMSPKLRAHWKLWEYGPHRFLRFFLLESALWSRKQYKEKRIKLKFPQAPRLCGSHISVGASLLVQNSFLNLWENLLRDWSNWHWFKD